MREVGEKRLVDTSLKCTAKEIIESYLSRGLSVHTTIKKKMVEKVQIKSHLTRFQ